MTKILTQIILEERAVIARVTEEVFDMKMNFQNVSSLVSHHAAALSALSLWLDCDFRVNFHFMLIFKMQQEPIMSREFLAADVAFELALAEMNREEVFLQGVPVQRLQALRALNSHAFRRFQKRLNLFKQNLLVIIVKLGISSFCRFLIRRSRDFPRRFLFRIVRNKRSAVDKYFFGNELVLQLCFDFHIIELFLNVAKIMLQACFVQLLLLFQEIVSEKKNRKLFIFNKNIASISPVIEENIQIVLAEDANHAGEGFVLHELLEGKYFRKFPTKNKNLTWNCVSSKNFCSIVSVITTDFWSSLNGRKQNRQLVK